MTNREDFKVWGGIFAGLATTAIMSAYLPPELGDFITDEALSEVYSIDNFKRASSNFVLSCIFGAISYLGSRYHKVFIFIYFGTISFCLFFSDNYLPVYVINGAINDSNSVIFRWRGHLHINCFSWSFLLFFEERQRI